MAAHPPIDLAKVPARPRDADRRHRARLGWWDRVKYLVLVALVYGVLFVQILGENPIRSTSDSWFEAYDSYRWLLWIGLAELVRQAHFLVAEHWSRYHLFWRRSIFARIEDRSLHMDPWNRYRLGRAVRFAISIGVLGLMLGRIYDEAPSEALIGFPTRLWGWLPVIFQYSLLIVANLGVFVAIFWFLSRGGIETYFPDDIDTRFDDVWGQDGVKAKIRENLIFLENPDAIEARGGYTPGGILLWGPPGTGKTLLAEASAGETGKPFVFVEPGAFINMFFGVGILKVKRLFRKLRKLSVRYGGVVVFLDEADSLGNRGALGQGGGFKASPLRQLLDDAMQPGAAFPYLTPAAQAALQHASVDAARRDAIIMGGMGGGGMGTLQALLTELSGLRKPRGFFNRVVRKALGMRPKPPPRYRILMMLATNMPEALDEALLRPGRIDRIYKVGYPSKEGRKRTYEGYLAKVRHCLTESELERLAVITPYATGAVIKDMVNEALINAIRDGREVINWSDLIKAKQLKEHGVADDQEYVEHERHALAIHEACHAVAALRLRHHLVIDVATIERRGAIGGFVASVPPEDRFTHWRSEYETDLQVSLASLAGERLFFAGDNSSGVGGDLRNATNLATMMTGYWGMGGSLASHEVRRMFGLGSGRRRTGEDDPEQPFGDSDLADEVETKLGEMYDSVHALLVESRRDVLCVAHALEWHKTLTGEDVTAIVEGSAGPTLDGRCYQDPSLLRAIEQYHDLVLAHRRAGDDEPLPLPVPSGAQLVPEPGH